MSKRPGPIRVALSHLWRVPITLACLLVGFGLFLSLRPTWPVGEIVVNSPTPIAAPLSGRPVCAYHMYVEHGGSTGLSRVWADSLEHTAPDGVTGPAEVRWYAPGPEYEIVDGATRSATGELLVDTDSERVARCRSTTCVWTEKLVPCGSTFTARWDTSGGTVYLERARRGLEGAATTWVILGGVFVLVVVSLPLRWLFRIRGTQDDGV